MSVKHLIYNLLAMLLLAWTASAAAPLPVPAEVASALAEYRRLRAEEPAAAAAFIARAADQHQAPALLFEAAAARLSADDLPAAVDLLDRVLAADAEFPGARRNRAALRLRQGRWEAALADLEAVAGSERADPELWRAIAQCQERLGDVAGAIATWTRLAWTRPEAADAQLALARCHLAATRPDLAARHLERAITLGADGPAVRLSQARLAAANGQANAVIDSLETARCLDGPLPPVERELLARAYLHEGMPREAAALLPELADDAAAELRPATLAAALAVGDTTTATRVAKALGAAAEAPRGAYLLGLLAWRQGDQDRARQLWAGAMPIPAVARAADQQRLTEHLARGEWAVAAELAERLAAIGEDRERWREVAAALRAR